MRLSLVLGVALILGMVVVWDRHEVFPAELDQRSSEGFAKAAHVRIVTSFMALERGKA